MTSTLTLCIFCLPLLQTPDSPRARLDALLPGLASADAGELDRAWSSFESMVFQAGRPQADEERKALALAIAGRLGEPLAVDARVRMLRALESIGKGEVVPALAKLITPGNDAAIREGARRALEANPHVNAKKELRTALKQADGLFRAGILRSIGARRDFLATADLIEAVEDKDGEVRLAAIDALAEVGDISAVPVLEEALKSAAGPTLAPIQHAYLRLGDSLVRNGERGAARRVYDKASGFSPEARCASLTGFARAGLQSEVDRIVSALADPDMRVRGAAVEAAVLMPKDGMTKAILAKLGGGDDEVFLTVLGRRGDGEARAALLGIAESGKTTAQRAIAIRWVLGMALEKDRDRFVRALLESAGAGGELGSAAEEALSSLSDGRVTRAVADAVAPAQGEKKSALLRVLAARRDPSGLDAVRAAAKDPALATRLVALRALGEIGDAASTELLLEALRSQEAAEREMALASLGRLRGEEAAKALAAAIESEKGPLRAALLRAAGARSEAWAVPVLRAAAASADAETRLAGVEGLARSGDASVLPVLMEAAEKGSPDVQRAAVRGCLLFAGALAREKPADATRVYLKTLELSKEEESLRAALRGIAETGGPETLDSIVPHLRAGALQRDAGRAALRIAERLPEEKQAGARGIYERILELDPDNATASQCVRRLRRIGVSVDLARKNGFVTHWWILAPLPNPNGSFWEASLPPETSVDLAKGLQLEGQTIQWTHYQTPSPRGLVALEEAGYPQSNAGAYLYAEITVAEACDALFKLGSDDQIACWLNGAKIHSNKVNRGLEVDQDTVPVKLERGANKVLLKVLNEGGGWGACLRVTGRDGKPLELTQREK